MPGNALSCDGPPTWAACLQTRPSLSPKWYPCPILSRRPSPILLRPARHRGSARIGSVADSQGPSALSQRGPLLGVRTLAPHEREERRHLPQRKYGRLEGQRMDLRSSRFTHITPTFVIAVFCLALSAENRHVHSFWKFVHPKFFPKKCRPVNYIFGVSKLVRSNGRFAKHVLDGILIDCVSRCTAQRILKPEYLRQSISIILIRL